MDLKWNYGGNVFPFDITSPDCLGRMSKVFSLKDGLDGDDSALSPAEKAERICSAVRSFFSALFGEEDSALITGETRSAARCVEAYLDFIAFLGRQIDDFARIREAVEEKYALRASSLADCAADCAADCRESDGHNGI